MAENDAPDPQERSIAVTKLEGGRWELTTTRIQLYKDSAVGGALGGAAFGASGALGGAAFGAIGGLLGGIVKAVSERKPTGDGIPLSAIKSVKTIPGKGGKGTFVISFVNGKEVQVPDVHDVVQFAAKVTEQVAVVRAAPAAAAPAKAASVLTLDTRVKGLPGWQTLQQWSPASLDGDPGDVRLKIDLPGTSESVFLRTKDELGNCTVRLVYRFAVVSRFAYVALRVRSDGKNYGLVRLNNKGEFFVSGTAPQGAHAWTKHPGLHTDTTQANEAIIELAGGTLRLSLNGTHAIAKDGLHGPIGRVVIGGGADPKPAEISVGAFEIRTV